MRCTLFISLILAITTFGCGSEVQTDTGETMVTPANDRAQSDSQVSCNATSPGELCVLVKVPELAPSVPTKVSVHFFSSLPPMGPPTILGAEIAERSELDKFRPGALVPVNIAGLPNTGALYLYGVLYMPGGGAETWRTTANIDYHGAYSWDSPIPFTGAPINLDSTLEFAVYSESVQ